LLRVSNDDFIPVLNERQKFLNDIRSYVNNFTSNFPEKREFSINFFNRNKSNHKVYQALIQITDNLEDAYDLRLQTITILKKVFNKRDFDSYIKVKKSDYEFQNSEHYEKSNNNNYNDYTKMLGDGVNSTSKMTDDYLNLMLPSAQINNDLSLKEGDDHLLSHIGFSFDRKNKNNKNEKNVKVSLIDSLFYIDQENVNNVKLKDSSKILIIKEMKNLPDLQNYKKMVDRHFDKYMLFDACENNYFGEHLNNGNNKVSEKSLKNFENTKNFIESHFKTLIEKGSDKENHLFEVKDKIQTHFEDPLPIKLNDEDNWKKLISSADLTLQQFNVYNFNLDLYTKYGPLLWKKYTDNFEALVNLLGKEKNELNEKCDQINKERKFNQVII